MNCCCSRENCIPYGLKILYLLISLCGLFFASSILIYLSSQSENGYFIGKIILWITCVLSITTLAGSIIYTYIAEVIMGIPTWNSTLRNDDPNDDVHRHLV